MTEIDGITVRIAADTGPMRREMEAIGTIAERAGDTVGRSLTGAFEGAILRGESLSDTLRSLALDLSRVALNAALSPLRQAAGTALGNVVGGLFGAADGAVVSGGRLTPFARGGIVDGPVAFPLSGGTGLMGEAGPEAILPLARGADGRLGVAAQGASSGSAARPVSVTVNIATPDAASFRRSEAQIAGVMSRALARAGRTG